MFADHDNLSLAAAAATAQDAESLEPKTSKDESSAEPDSANEDVRDAAVVNAAREEANAARVPQADGDSRPEHTEAQADSSNKEASSHGTAETPAAGESGTSDEEAAGSEEM